MKATSLVHTIDRTLYLTAIQEMEYKNITMTLRKAGADALADKRDNVVIVRLHTVPQVWDLIAIRYQGKLTRTTRTLKKLSWDEAGELSQLVISGMVPPKARLSEVLELVGFYYNSGYFE